MKSLLALKKLILIALLVLALLSSCEEAVEIPEIIEGLPEISFILIYNSGSDEIMNGSFIDNRGVIKDFTFENKSLIPHLGDPVSRGSNNYNQMDMNFIGALVMENYNAIIEVGTNTKKRVNPDELTQYYDMLANIDAERVKVGSGPRDTAVYGFANYYGIRKKSGGESEIILLKGRGDVIYDSTDQYANELFEWLKTTIIYPDRHKGDGGYIDYSFSEPE